MTKYDLEERTAKFGEEVITFAKTIPKNAVTLPLITQLVRAGTSVGANYSEADNACSKRDFVNKIGICRKESRECTHWLRMTTHAEAGVKSALWQHLVKESRELNLIFSAIVNKCGKSDLSRK